MRAVEWEVWKKVFVQISHYPRFEMQCIDGAVNVTQDLLVLKAECWRDCVRILIICAS